MGTLYYIAKTDGSRELFALNKVFRYDRAGVLRRLQGEPLTAVFEDEAHLSDALVAAYDTRPDQGKVEPWLKRVAARLVQWAGCAPLDFMSEYTQEEFHSGLNYEQSRALITGSAHDSDYEDDGVTYKPGSAW